MAVEMSSSQCEMVHKQRPVMSTDLFLAAMKGDGDVLIQCLGLPKEQKEVKVTIEAAHPTSQQIEADQHVVQDVLGSVTQFGDTLLHLLVIEMHNELALNVFQRDRSLMKARNKNSETPLHYAAKVSNVKVIQDLIQLSPDVVKDAVREIDENKDTALHVAAKHGHGDVARELMKLDPGVANMFNKEGFTPLYIATVEGYDSMVKTMLEVDSSLARELYSNGMYPVHVAALVGNKELVMHFIEKYPDEARLRDHRGQNLFHIAAEENKVEIFKKICENQKEFMSKMGLGPLNGKDYKGNTPLHIAAMKGHTSVMRIINEIMPYKHLEVKNNQGRTPSDLSKNQKGKNALKDKNIWDRTQVIGLGSVLITTVTFAAAFTIPGGYNQNNGAPILGRKYIFKAFILANTESFVLAFISVFTLVSSALHDPKEDDLYYATYTFIGAAGFMILAFGLGSYVMLAPVNLPIAIIVLLFTIPLVYPSSYVRISEFWFGFIRRYVKSIPVISSRVAFMFVVVFKMMAVFFLALA